MFWTIFGTVISGVLVYVLGEICKCVWFDQLTEYKQLKGNIAYALVFYAREYGSPVNIESVSEDERKKLEEISTHFRDLGSRMYAISEFKYPLSFRIPNRNVLNNAASSLIGISNSLYTNTKSESSESNGARYAQKIRELLNLQH